MEHVSSETRTNGVILTIDITEQVFAHMCTRDLDVLFHVCRYWRALSRTKKIGIIADQNHWNRGNDFSYLINYAATRKNGLALVQWCLTREEYDEQYWATIGYALNTKNFDTTLWLCKANIGTYNHYSDRETLTQFREYMVQEKESSESIEAIMDMIHNIMAV